MRDEKIFLNGEEIKNSKKAPIVEPKIFIGGAANPFADPFEFRVIRLAKKAKAGVDFIQTQCVYDMERFEGIAGVHIMAIAWESKVREIVERSGLLPRVSVAG